MKDTKWPPFPAPYSNEADGPTMMPTQGMTLRDYFAAKASEEDINEHIFKGHKEDYAITDGYGRKAIIKREAMRTREEARYRYADAMLKARQS